MENKPKGAILRKEGTPRKNPSLPSGTFTIEGSPTVVLDLIGIKVAREGSDLKKINSRIFGMEIVDLLDGLGLLPTNISKDQKVTKVLMQVAWMVTDQMTIKTGQAHLYSACKKSYRKAEIALKIAAKNS